MGKNIKHGGRRASLKTKFWKKEEQKGKTAPNKPFCKITLLVIDKTYFLHPTLMLHTSYNLSSILL
jgi:hypothetical protein